VLDGGAAVRLTGPGESQSLPRLSVYVGVGRPKSPAASAIVEAATELGAVEIAFFTTERSVVRAPGGDGRWRRITSEACKQCGRFSPPRVAEPMDLAAWADQLPADAVRLRLAETGGDLLDRARLESACAVAMLFGPEGGLTPAEEALAAQVGFAPISLGPLVMRVETAVIAGVARLAPIMWRDE
jgi:16S rRNA (uracil1498-N3)-methyltransferase